MSPVAAHASVSKSDGTIRILLIAKDLTSHEDANIDVCVRGATVKAIATAKTLVASNGDVVSKVSLMNTSTPTIRSELKASARGQLFRKL
jgi:hypothetical protein